MKTFKTAVIGCGMISKNHFKALKNVENADCVVACDIRPERAAAAAEASVPSVYATERRLRLCCRDKFICDLEKDGLLFIPARPFLWFLEKPFMAVPLGIGILYGSFSKISNNHSVFIDKKCL